MSKSNLVTIFSMLSNDQSFPIYAAKKKDGKQVSVNKSKSAILIKGGANVASKHTQTSKFVETQVSAEDFKLLEESPVFKRMVARGFLSTEKPAVAKKDKSAPLTEKDVKAKNAKATVVTNEQKPE